MKGSVKNFKARNYQRNNSIKFSRIEKCYIQIKRVYIPQNFFNWLCYVPEHIAAYKCVCKVFSNVSDDFLKSEKYEFYFQQK